MIGMKFVDPLFLRLSLIDPYQISMFKAIMSTEPTLQLQQLCQKFFGRANIIAALLCFDHVFHAISRPAEISSQRAMVDLPILVEYARLLILDPSEAFVQKLLGIQKQPRNHFLIPTQTTLYKVLKDYQMFPGCSTDEGMRLSGRELLRAARTFFRNRLRYPLSLVVTIKILKDWPLSTSLRFVR
jgi:hypothetical protein